MKFLFLDRDGVINQRPPGDYVKSPDTFIFEEGVLESMPFLAEYFSHIFLVTNQQGIGKGLMTEADLEKVHHKMLTAIKEAGGKIDRIYFCPHLATEKCACRKPGIGMALRAKKEFPALRFKDAYMVGDTYNDMRFGKRCAMKTILIGKDKEALKNLRVTDMQFDSLSRWVQYMKKTLCLLVCFIMLSTHLIKANNDTINQIDKKGRKQGYWNKKDPHKKLNYQGFFYNNLPQGEMIYTDQKGVIRVKSHFFRGGYACFTQMYDPSGKILLSEGYYLDKQKDSLWTFYDEKARIIKKEFYKNNLLNGLSELYDEQGKIIQTQEWYRGLRHGKWVENLETGKQILSYHMNKSNGPYLAFYADSSLRIKGNYQDGLKEGLWEFFHPDKSLYKKEVYSNNKLFRKELYLVVKGERKSVNIEHVSLIRNIDNLAVVYFKNGEKWDCDQDFNWVCNIFEPDFFFLANSTTFVSFSIVERVEAMPEEEGGEEYALLLLKQKFPFQILIDQAGQSMLNSVKSNP